MSRLIQAIKTFDNLFEIKEINHFFTTTVKEQFGMQNYALFLISEDKTRFEMVSGEGPPQNLPADFSFPNQEGPLQRMIFRGKPFQAGDNGGRCLFADQYQKYHLTALKNTYFAPLMHFGDVIGVISMGQKQNDEPYTEDDLEFVTILAERTAASIATARLHEKKESDRIELDKMLKNLSILYNISRAMIQINDLKNLLRFILKQAIDTISAQKGSLMLYDHSTKRLVVRVVRGLPDKATEDAINSGEMTCATFGVGEGIAGHVFATQQPMIVNSTQYDKHYKANEGSNVDSILCLPLVASDETIGVINITNKIEGEKFTSEDLELLTALGNQAAVAINNATLHEMAITDELTSLYIRRYFNVRLDMEIKRAQRYNHSLSLAICDLDHFKSVNDTYGHQKGDVVLREVAALLMKNVREIDTPARYGGEEFAIILPETDTEGAAVVCERIRRKVEGLKIEGMSQQITVSIGIATFSRHASDVSGLIEAADRAMYQAKNEGRNRVCFSAS
jgi:diguanylate cyclase (GGDEF)-like protein